MGERSEVTWVGWRVRIHHEGVWSLGSKVTIIDWGKVKGQRSGLEPRVTWVELRILMDDLGGGRGLLEMGAGGQRSWLGSEVRGQGLTVSLYSSAPTTATVSGPNPRCSSRTRPSACSRFYGEQRR